MTKNKARIESVLKDIKKTQREIKKSSKQLQAFKSNLENLNERFEDLLIQDSSSKDSSSEESIESLNIGDHVISITEPHGGRTGELVYVGAYWARVRCDRNNNQIFKKAKSNLRLTVEDDQRQVRPVNSTIKKERKKKTR